MRRERHYSLFDWLWIASITLGAIAGLFLFAYFALERML